jgi:hypothetical protein
VVYWLQLRARLPETNNTNERQTMNALTAMISSLSIDTLKVVVMSLRKSYSDREFMVFEAAFNELEIRLSDSDFAAFAKSVEAAI